MSAKKSSVFDRLFSQATISSAQKRVGKTAAAGHEHSTARRKPGKKVISKKEETVSQSSMKTANVTAPENAHPDPPPPKTKQSMVDGLSRSTSIRLLCSSKYSPDQGFSEISVASLNLFKILRNYEDGDVSQREVAKKIIEALWDRDFMTGERWSVDSACVREHEENGLYVAEKEATWDWKDIYAVATAKGNVRFLDHLKEIRIEMYSYYCAG